MQHISVADHYIESVESGDKKIAIRIGTCHIEPGPLEVKSASGIWGSVKVIVDKVEARTVVELTPDELRACGYTSIDQLIELQRSCYPCLTPHSDVTVIRWH
jgi:hypothetical protein